MKTIDLRSDTVTRPTAAMRAAMAAADVGDDVYEEDPSVNRLQETVADLLGLEEGLFVPSGTMSNLLAIMSHCGRGDEYIAGDTAHCYRFEGGGAAVLGSVQPHPLPFSADGTLDLALVAQAVKPKDLHFARTRLLCLENTNGGAPLPLQYLRDAATFCRKAGLKLHLDGARLVNAAVVQNAALRDLAAGFDTVSLCLSKGLGAPVGSVLCGTSGVIGRARRWRKVLGGGMRQAGILAAAALVALDEGPERLQEDHDNARFLAERLQDVGRANVRWTGTNMVFWDLEPSTASTLSDHLKTCGILIGGRESVRLVTHRDVSRSDVIVVAAAIADFFSSTERNDHER